MRHHLSPRWICTLLVALLCLAGRTAQGEVKVVELDLEFSDYAIDPATGNMLGIVATPRLNGLHLILMDELGRSKHPYSFGSGGGGQIPKCVAWKPLAEEAVFVALEESPTNSGS